MVCRALFVLLFATAADDRSTAFPPGWNGKAKTPPLGWRSWNAFGNRITQGLLEQQIDALVAKNRTIAGQDGLVSLCDLGYCNAGVDEGWEGCGAGVNHSQHDAQGHPTVQKNQFPDLKSLVDYGHKAGLSMGWYLNGCKCGEHHALDINYEGDVKDLHEYGFDDVKIDGCGRQLNMTFYAELMKATGKSYAIENCHWGRCSETDASSCPTREWCPFTSYRSSGDINAGSSSWMRNLQTTIRFQDKKAPLSQPGCWAYPDMLEVGRVREPMKGTFYTWNRAHFGAWCIVSSPLTLGMDLTDANLNPVMDIIGNHEAIQVNQQWAGHPGFLADQIKLGAGQVQVWAKPQEGGVAVLVINDSNETYSGDVAFTKLDMPLGKFTAVRDIWNHKDMGTVSEQVAVKDLGAYDSVFMLLTTKPGEIVV